MKLAMVGLGRMGASMAERLAQGGHECVVYDRDPKIAAGDLGPGTLRVSSLDALVEALTPPRVVWLMLPCGEPTETTIAALSARLSRGDIIVDGGNTFFKDDIRRARELAQRGLHYVDVGTSGGVWGRTRGYCLMIGGQVEVVERLDPLFRTLAPGRGTTPATPGAEGSTSTEGYLHCGTHGAGHFVKMVHNGIEYGMMQAFAEGFDLMRHANDPSLPEGQRLSIDLAEVAEVWRRGSVVSSWLLDLSAAALRADPSLENYSGNVQDSGEGRWTIQTAIEEAVPVPVLSAALFARFRSRQSPSFADQMLSALRDQFGGHKEPPATKS